MLNQIVNGKKVILEINVISRSNVRRELNFPWIFSISHTTQMWA